MNNFAIYITQNIDFCRCDTEYQNLINSKTSDSDRTVQKILCEFRVIIDLWVFSVIGEELQEKQTKTAFFCQ